MTGIHLHPPCRARKPGDKTGPFSKFCQFFVQSATNSFVDRASEGEPFRRSRKNFAFFYIPVPARHFLCLQHINLLTTVLPACDNSRSFSERGSKQPPGMALQDAEDGEFYASYNRTLPQAFIAHPSHR